MISTDELIARLLPWFFVALGVVTLIGFAAMYALIHRIEQDVEQSSRDLERAEKKIELLNKGQKR